MALAHRAADAGIGAQILIDGSPDALLDADVATRKAARRNMHVGRQSAQILPAHADRRFRSEYYYALFEYYRSAKVIAFLKRAGVAVSGRVLDAGCGGGGMPLSLAEHASDVIGIDPIDRSLSVL